MPERRNSVSFLATVADAERAIRSLPIRYNVVRRPRLYSTTLLSIVPDAAFPKRYGERYEGS
jgi:uncharacterized protein YbjT (DUF2867 family)